METTAYDRLRKDFTKAHFEKLGAILASIGAALSYLLLFVFLYLFVDLLVWHGHIPTFAQLTALKQREFAEEWAKRPEEQRVEAVARVLASDAPANRISGKDISPAPSSAEWELRWQAGVYLRFAIASGRPLPTHFVQKSLPRNQLAIMSKHRESAFSVS